MTKIALISWSKQEESMAIQEHSKNPMIKDWIKEQSAFIASDGRIILPEDRLLISALSAQGLQAETISWEDPSRNWVDYSLCIIRTVWLWHINPEKFFKFAEKIEGITQVWNSVALMKWGSSKKYLLELAEKGVPVTPSIVIPAKSLITLSQVVEENKFIDFIFKPDVSQGSRDIIRASCENKLGYHSIKESEPIFKNILSSRDVIVQPYLKAIETEGEISVVVIKNKITHAVRKIPSKGGFLSAGYPLTKEEIFPLDNHLTDLVYDILNKITIPMDFGRFDLIRGNDGNFLVSELELISPRLFLQYSDFSLNYFVQCIKDSLGHYG